ncbi:MAG TPA: GNAT family N-acetyltransferase [Bacteroidales bacterium]|nr:GNAT family N-acetyltransferase [Bacteroidales bacterium]
MIIRKATFQDAVTLAENQVRMAMESENMKLDYQTVIKGREAYLNDPGKGTCYIAQEDGQIAGSLMVTREWSDWRNGWIWWIQSVYVLPEFRRRGVYKALYEHLQKLVNESPDVLGIRLYAEKNNRKALAAYRSLGMSDDHYVTFEWMKI